MRQLWGKQLESYFDPYLEDGARDAFIYAK
jgi:hypothetical protein